MKDSHLAFTFFVSVASIAVLSLWRASERLGRRVYIRVWLWRNRYCKHAVYIGGLYDQCDMCDEESRAKKQAESERSYAAMCARRRKARRLVSEL